MNLPDFNLANQKSRDALRLGIQSAIAAAVTFIAIDAVGTDEKFAGILTAVMIVQPSIGGTTSQGWDRMISTIVGCVIGVACLFLLPSGYGTLAALVFAMFVMNFIAGFRPGWRQGVVAAVALSLSHAEDGSVDVAIARATAIGIGIVAGIIVALIVWPDSAAHRAERHRQAIWQALRDRLAAVMAFDRDEEGADSARRAYNSALSDAREATRAMHSKKRGAGQKRLNALEELYSSIMLLDRSIKRLDERGGDKEQHVQSKLKSLKDKAIAIFDDILDGKTDISVSPLREESNIEGGKDVDGEEAEKLYAVRFALDEIANSLEACGETWGKGDSSLIDRSGTMLGEAVPNRVESVVTKD
ncbi:MAG: FUSC family protein [Henriciella sp.]|uniref:FUSC family protein n=1 Tax=Henriciella sp. TaxID=1968823 RepID=UPI003C7130D6